MAEERWSPEEFLIRLDTDKPIKAAQATKPALLREVCRLAPLVHALETQNKDFLKQIVDLMAREQTALDDGAVLLETIESKDESLRRLDAIVRELRSLILELSGWAKARTKTDGAQIRRLQARPDTDSSADRKRD